MKTALTLAALLVLALLTACGGTKTVVVGPGGDTSSAAPQQSAAGAGPGGVPVIKTVKQGQPFTLSYPQGNGTATWRVALDNITCGALIFDSSIIREFYSSEGQPVKMPQPDPGQQFCLVKFDVTNDGITNQPWSANVVTVNVGSAAYADQINGPGYDAEQAYMQNAQPSGETSDFGFNPGQHGVSWAVIEIPATAQPTSVSVPDGNSLQELGGAQQVLVRLS